MPGTPKRGTSSRARSSRAKAARPAARPRRQATRAQAARFGWSRRVGVAAAMLLLVGAGIALAGGTLTGGGPDAGRTPTPTRAAAITAPTVIAPVAVTKLAEIDIDVSIPSDAFADGARRVRVLVNDKLARERDLDGAASVAVRGIALREGTNEIRAALAGGDGEGELSAPVTVIRDSRLPHIHISRPDPGSVVYGETVTLRGRTEAGATLTITNEATGTDVPATVEDDGSFEAELPLEMGGNAFVLASEDAAGNGASAQIVLTRSTSLGTVDLTVSASELNYRELPQRLDVLAVVRDEQGIASSGAEVVFSLSPPNRSTSTYQATTTNGEARWPEMVVAGDERAIGTWLVTVLVTLPSGEELRGDASFTVR